MQVTESMVALIVPTRSSSQLNAGDLEFGITSVKRVLNTFAMKPAAVWYYGLKAA